MDSLKIDSHKLEFHPHRVAAWRDSGDDWEKAKKVYPIYIEISPMGACNHRCTFCAVDYIGYKAVQLDASLLGERLLEMGSLGVKSVMFAGEGEPLLHKNINRMVRFAQLAGIDTSFTTNGTLLDHLHFDGVSWVKVSINAGKRETYGQIHRTKAQDWDRVWQNIKNAVHRKGTCKLGVQMVCLPENAGEEKEIQALCDDTGVDYLVFKPYSQHKMSITRQYKGYKPIALPEGKGTVIRHEAIRTEGHEYSKCNATPFFWCYVMASGDIYSCSAYLLDERFRLGNINEHGFQSIWEGERRRANWELVRKKLDIHECRLNCRMNQANKFLWGFDHQEHVNFV